MTLIFVWQTKDGSGDAPFPPVKDVAQFHVAHARSSKVLSMDFSALLVGGILNSVFRIPSLLFASMISWQLDPDSNFFVMLYISII